MQHSHGRFLDAAGYCLSHAQDGGSANLAGAPHEGSGQRDDVALDAAPCAPSRASPCSSRSGAGASTHTRRVVQGSSRRGALPQPSTAPGVLSLNGRSTPAANRVIEPVSVQPA